MCRISKWGTRKHNQNRVRVQRVQGLDRQANRTAMLTLTSCALLLLLLLLVPESILGFPKKKVLFDTSRTRVACLIHSFFGSVCFTAVSSCVIHLFVGDICPLGSTHTAAKPVPAGPVHAHAQTKLPRAGAVVSREISNGFCFLILPIET